MKVTRRQLIAWSVITALALAALAQWLSSSNDNSGPRKGVFLPLLMAHSPKLTQVRIDTQQAQPWITMEFLERGWQVKEADGYPANSTRLAKLIQGLSRTQIIADAEFPTATHAATAPWNTAHHYAEQTALYQLTILGEGNYYRHIWLNDSAADRAQQWLRVDKERFSYQLDHFVSIDATEGGWLQTVELANIFEQAGSIRLETANQGEIELDNSSQLTGVTLANHPINTLNELQNRLQTIVPLTAKRKGKGAPGQFKYSVTLWASEQQLAEIIVYQDEQYDWLDISLQQKKGPLTLEWYLAL